MANGDDRYNRYEVEDPHGLVVITLIAAVASTTSRPCGAGRLLAMAC